MTIKTRKPTGKAPWPMLLLAGVQKSGKSYACAAFSASDLIDRTFYIEVGEGSADQVIESKGLKQVTDSSAIETMLDEMLAANAGQVEQYRASDEAKRAKMFGFFVGQAMKASKGKANPQQVNELLKSKLEG